MKWLNTLLLIGMLATIVRLLLFRQFKNSIVTAMLYYMLCYTLFSIAALALYYIYHIGNNLYLFHFLTPLLYGLTSYYFYKILEKAYLKKIVLTTGVLFSIACIFLSILIQPLHQNNSYAVVLSSTLIIIWGLLYLRQVFTADTPVEISAQPAFWISSGLLIHSIGKLFIQGLLNYWMAHNISLARKIYPLDYVFDFLLLLCIHIALHALRKSIVKKTIAINHYWT